MGTRLHLTAAGSKWHRTESCIRPIASLQKIHLCALFHEQSPQGCIRQKEDGRVGCLAGSVAATEGTRSLLHVSGADSAIPLRQMRKSNTKCEHEN